MKYKRLFKVETFLLKLGSVVPHSINAFIFLEDIFKFLKSFNFLSKKIKKKLVKKFDENFYFEEKRKHKKIFYDSICFYDDYTQMTQIA